MTYSDFTTLTQVRTAFDLTIDEDYIKEIDKILGILSTPLSQYLSKR